LAGPLKEAAARPWRQLVDGIVVNVRATPKSGRNAMDGIAEVRDGQMAIKVRVRAAPADGKANQSIARVLADVVGVPPSSVELLQGAAGRLKTFRISGDPVRLTAALEKATGTKETQRK
jgi:uncharacterized protein (TIGR00251 family)